jgi:recombination DNA repair RAD52 pathway protein
MEEQLIQKSTMNLESVLLQLDENIPGKAVSTRNQSGRDLAYLETWYVIDRLNKVFGALNWAHTVVSMTAIPGTDKPAYSCHVRLTVILPSGQIIHKDGFGYGSDKSSHNPGEMATKEAESDALKRAAMKYGLSMGLALYDKTQEFVDHDETKSSPKGGSPASKYASSKPAPAAVKAPAPVAQTQPAASAQKNRENLNQLITSTAKVLVAKKLSSMDAIKRLVKLTYNVDAKEDLTDSQAVELLKTLEQTLNQGANDASN